MKIDGIDHSGRVDAVVCRADAAQENAPNLEPVKAVAEPRLAVGNQGILPLDLSSDWTEGGHAP